MSQSRFWNLLAKKMAGEASEEEMQELETLMQENPDWAYSTGYLHKLWKSGDKTADAYSSELAFEDHLYKLKQSGINLPEFENPSIPVDGFYKREQQGKRKWWVLGAAFAACVFAGILIWNFASTTSQTTKPTQAYSEVNTRPGSKTTKLVLPDSSVVWLNAGSRLTYSEQFGIVNRLVTLTGEAFFDVKKTKIPFIIHTNDVQIKVLGTAFNVRSYPNEKTETSLLRGNVEITLANRPGEKWLLKPNEKLVVSNGQKAVKQEAEKKEPLVVLSPLIPQNDNSFAETSWMENRLVFEDESFSELAVKMERWYGLTIVINDENVARQRLSGSFTTETIQEAMEALQLSTSFHFSLKSNTITITK